jgi:hypothetical protein
VERVVITRDVVLDNVNPTVVPRKSPVRGRQPREVGLDDTEEALQASRKDPANVKPMVVPNRNG